MFPCFSQVDAIHVTGSEILILQDTIYAPTRDTVITIARDQKFRVRPNPYKSSEAFYRNMKEFSGGNRITARLFDLLFVSDNTRTEDAPTSQKRTSNAPFIPYEGFTIGRIRIKHVDVMEGSVHDTTRIARSKVARVVNRTHLDTWNSVIRNNLMLVEGETIDPYALADNERLLRRLRFIEDARIYLKPLPDHQAEVIVVVKDRISWAFSTGGRNLTDFKLELFNRNIAGWGKSASASWFHDEKEEPLNGYDLRMAGQNINKAITNWELNHTNNADRKSWGINIQKEFVTPEIKYGGGIDLRTIRDSTIQLDGEEVKNGFYDLTYQDLWIGRSFLLPSKHHRKNLIIGARFLNNSFDVQPFVSRDSNSLYFNRRLLLSEITLSDQRFIKSNYILSFGISEDIPVGYRYSIILGNDINEFYSQPYFGFRMFWSFYFNRMGYLMINQAAGTFDHHLSNEGVIKTELNYFSPLISMRRYHLRNFFTIQYITGFNQPVTKHLSLEDRVRDIKGYNLEGNSLFVTQVESVVFTPWYYFGFRFAPFAFYSVSNAWDTRLEENFSYNYHSVGCGFRIRNESLVFNTFEFRVTQFLPRLYDARATQFSFVFSVPLAFNRIFQYKPRLVSYR